MSRDILAELERATTGAAAWVDRLKEGNTQDAAELCDWLRQSRDHLEEFLCAVAIDLAIHALADRNSLGWRRSVGSTHDTSDSVQQEECGLPGHVLAKIRVCAAAIVGNDGAVDDVLNRALQLMGPVSGDMDSAQVERQAFDTTRTTSRAWLEEWEAQKADDRQPPSRQTLAEEADGLHLALAELRERLTPLGERRIEMFVCVRFMGRPVGRVARDMGIRTQTVKEELGQVYLRFMTLLDESQVPDTFIVSRLLTLFKHRLRSRSPR